MVRSIQDPTVERDETLQVLLGELMNIPSELAALVTVQSSGIGTITNDDTATLTVSHVRELEGDSDTTSFEFSVTLSAPVDTALSVTIATADGTAVNEDDYSASSDTLEFDGDAGETSS